MELQRHVARVLHDEHMAVIALLERFEKELLRGRTGPPDPGDVSAAALLAELAAAIDGEISDHFAFEEDALFPVLAGVGESGIGELLTEEHAVILPLGRRVAELARSARADGFDAAAWEEFSRLGAEFAERLIDHAQKEEMALVPTLDMLLDEAQDARIAEAYSLKE